MLPFKTHPTPPAKLLGAADIGELELPVYYGLTVNEHHYIEKQTKGLPDAQSMLVALAKKVADELKQEDVAQIVNQLSRISQHPEIESVVLKKHDKEYKQLQEQSQKRAKEERKAYVSAVLIHRLGVTEWKPEFIEDPEKIRSPLADEIYEFAIKEELGWRDPKELDNETVKKFLPGSTDPTPTTDDSTGNARSTGAEKTPDSAPNALAVSPSG